MSAYSWILGSGDWNSADNWSPSGGPPTSADSATIAATDSDYTVTVDSSDAAASLTLSSANATVNDTGALTIGGAFSFSGGAFNIGLSSTPGSLIVGGPFTLNGGALNVDDGTLSLGGVLTDSAGSITLASGGTISGGTVDVTGGMFNWNGGTLSGVTYEGTLNLTASGATGTVANGLTMAGSSGTGPGTINVTGESAYLYFDNTQTFDGATINLGSTYYYAPSYLYENDVSEAGNQVLTLGPGITIDIQGYAEIYAGAYSGDGIVSEGVINVTTAGAPLTIAGATFTNTGTINDTGGGLSIESAAFTNEGAIDVANGQTLTVPNGTTFTSATGTISLDGTSSLVVDEALTTAQFGAVDAASGATLDFAAGLNNAGATVTVGAGVLVEGLIDGGTIDGAINLTASGQSLALSGGPTVDNAAGTGPGTINVTGESAYLYFDNTQTFDGATINLGSTYYYAPSYLYENDVNEAGNQVLTLGPGITIDIQGYAEIYAGAYSGDGIVSEGVINVTTAGAPLTIAGATFTNTGTINDTGGGLSIESAAFTNEGAIDVANGQTLTVPNGTTFTSATGTISLDGTSSLVVDEALTTAQFGAVDAASGATLDFAAGLNNAGATVTVGAGVLVEGLIDGGTINGAINLTASGQSLALSGGPTVDNAAGTGPGTINVTGESAYLYFDNTQTFDGATINLGSTYYYAPSYLYENDVNEAGNQVLTLGPGVTIDIQGYAEIYAGAYSGDGIVSEGVINVTTAGAPLTIAGATFTNTGTINDTGGGLSIESAAFTNEGAIDVANGQTLTVPNGTTFTSATGTISLDGTSSLVVDEALTTAQFGAVDAASGATLDFAAGLNNAGATVTVGAGVLVEGLIDGGTINGAINLTASGQSLALSGGPTVDNAAGTGPGTINVTGESAYLYFDNTQTFDGATINLGSTYYYAPSYLYENDVNEAGNQVLTLGPGVTIDIQGYAEICAGAYSGDGIVSEGVINVTTAGAPLTIAGATFTNTGTINDTGGGLSIESAAFTNEGTIDVANGQTLTVPNGTTFTTTASSLITIEANSSVTIDPSNVWSNLGSITLASGSSLYLGGSITSGGLGSISNSGGTVYLEGTLSNSGQTLNGSSLGVVLYGGTITGGTVAGLGSSSAGGTLSGVTFDGTLTLTAYASIHLANGLTMAGSNGSGAGTINATGYDSYLYFDNTQTVSNATINLGNSSYYAFLDEYDTAGAGNQVLTLATSVTVDAQDDAYITSSGYSGDGIVNQGVIEQTGSGGSLIIEPNAFTNSGSIDAEATTASLDIEPATFTNSGAIDVANGDSVTIEPTTFTTTASSLITIEANSSVTIDPSNVWSNLGSITLASGSSLYLGGSITSGGLGSISNSGGTVYLEGTLSNSGQTLNGSSLGVVLYGGTITGGTVAGLGSSSAGGTLSGVTFDGTLTLTAYASIHLANGLTMAGSNGSGAGTINATGYDSYLYFDNTQTVSNATINLGNSSYYAFLDEYDTAGAGNQVLTLATSVTVDAQDDAYITSSGYSGDGIVNQGVIEQTGSGGSLIIEPNAFTNSGSIDAEATTASLDIEPATFTNSGAIDVANGDSVTIEPTTFTTTASSLITIEANSSVTIDPSNVWSNLGSITLASGSSLYLGGSITSGGLGSISNSGGTVYLEGTLSNSGQTLNGSSLGVVLYGGTITGGTVAGLGSSSAGGTLSGVTFDGTLTLTAYASIHLANGLTMAGSNGSGAGTINATGYDSYLYFDNTQTVSNATINLGNSSYYAFLDEYDTAGAGNQVLTLATSVTVDAQDDAYITSSGYSGDGIVNQGMINVGNGTLDEEALNFTNRGQITVSNGEQFNVSGTFTNDTAGEISGSGTVSGALTNNGLIDANGGNLDFTAAITGSGRLQIEAGSELELGAAIGEAATFAATTGKLRIDYPSSANYTGTISDFGGSDILELANTNASSVMPGAFNGATTTLSVNLNGGGTLTYTLAGDYSNDTFTLMHVNGNADSDIALSAVITGTPSISAPAAATVGVGQPGAISGISIAESPTTSSETFTVTLADANGLLSATGSGVSGSGTTSLSIAGSLAQVNSDLAKLSDSDSTTPSDTITINASDSNGGTATPARIAVTVNGVPAITAPTTAAVVQNQASAISGVSLAESGNAAGESFTVTLADASGDLSATGTGVSGSGTTSLTITGSLSQVNSNLATLSDTDAATAADTITLNASDSFGNSAASKSIAVTVTPQSGTPAITAPTAATVGVGQPGTISGITLSESNTTVGETFTVTLADTNGLLAATGTGVSGSGTTSLTISGSLSQVNTDLATLADADATTPSDTIAINASDNNGGHATPATIAVTVNGLPAIAAPTAATVTQNQASAISGVSLSESGNTAGESFTVTLADTSGDLSATGTGVSGSGTTSLTITGSLSQVNSDLATLSDTDAAIAADTIILNASDSFGNSAASKSIAVTVTPQSGRPAIAAPTAATVGVGQPGAISGVSLSESNATVGETFTVTLADTNGLLAATGTGVSGSGTTSLTISGSLSQVNTDLATLADTDATTPSDTIAVNASDSNGGTATPQTIALTVDGLPVIAAPASAAVQQNQATAISGLSLSESGNSSGETFTVTLSDAAGLLAASGGGTITGDDSAGLEISGSLAQVNGDLATLTDSEASTAADTITISASDGFGNSATPKSIAISVIPQSGTPSITAPASAVVGVGQPGAISGVSLAETPTTSGETFTVTLSDAQGDLSATGTGVSGSGTTSLAVTGSLTQVDSDLASLTDTDGTTGSDTITLNASNSNGGTAAPQTIAVTVDGLPVIAAPASAAVQQNQATAVSGLSLAESGSASGETFTVTLSDAAGLLSASGGGAITGDDGASLEISGSLAQVNGDLATLTDSEASTAADTITISASDGFGNSAASKSIAISVTPQSGTPLIAAPASSVVGVGQPGAISGVSLAETPTTSGETFTVTLADIDGLLSATGNGVSGAGTTILSITGSLAQVDSDLATLTDTDVTTPSDTITIDASDSNGGTATPASIAVTVNGLPALTTPTTATVVQNQASAISGVRLAESGNTAGESFTVTLADTSGDLSATGTGISGLGTTSLTIAGSLSQVNSDLGTLTDTDASTAADTITLDASDGFGNSAASKSIAVTVTPQSGTPSITAPATATVGVGQAGAISGVSLSESNTTNGESFTVRLADTNGLLAATGSGVSGSGTTSLSIAGSLAQVNSDLATLSDSDSTTPSDTITINASDSNGGTATPASIAVTVNGPPALTAPATATVVQNQASAISGVSLAESGSTAGESFTVTLADASGDLSATGTGVSGSGTTSLTITGSLSQVNSDLATLSDTDAAIAADTITLNARDGFVNSAASKSIAVTVTPQSGTPAITMPTTATVGVGQPGAISGVSLSESNTTVGETFTVTLADSDGLLAATGTGVSGSGTTGLSISGSLSQVNTDLATLTDADATAPSDTITINATDSNGGNATPATIAVTVNGLPALTTPTTATVVQNQASAISGVSLAESGDTAGESFTVTLADTSGDLSATGTGISGSGTTSLTIAGSLSQVNSDLGTLADTDASTAADTLTVNASDSFGNSAASKSIAVTVTPQSGTPSITAPAAATVGVGRAGAISGVSISESNTTVGETFTVTLADTNGLLAATGTGVSGSGTTSLTISGSLSQVNTDLATLADTDATTPSDTIAVNASDSNGGTAAPQTIAVTVNGLPVIATPASAAVQQNQATAISGLSLAESGNTSGETFTVTLSDAAGLLAASGGGTITGDDSTSLEISGSLAQVNSDLATLTDSEASTAADTITISASDSFGNSATPKSIAISVTPQSGTPSITAPASAVVGVGQPGAISGVSLAETPTTTGETFTVTLSDAQGDLSATGTGVSGSGTTNLTITGSLTQVNSDLATLTDTDGTAGSDTIALNAGDSNGGTAAPQTIAVTINALPTIAAPTAATVTQSQASAISGVSLAESGNTSGETFTVTLSDAAGLLAASGGGTITGDDSTSLQISGSLAQVNSALATLTESDASTAADRITVNATDDFGNSAVPKSIAISVTPQPGTPTITAPASAVVGVGQPAAIAGLSLSESSTTSGETFTVTLSDAQGDLSASGTGVSGSGTTSLTIAGSLTQVNSDLAALTDTDETAGSDTITIDASDSNGGTATPQTIAVTVNGLPVIAAPTTATVTQGQASAISAVSLAESGDTPSESFTVTLSDASGDLSATGTGVSGLGTTSLTISGSLAQVNSALATLTDSDASTAADTITLNASDSFGNSAASKSIAISVTPQSGTPSITAPATATVGVGQAGAISGVSLSESNTTNGESFTVTLADTSGLLSATGNGVSGSGTTSLSITGPLSQVNNGLATLIDEDSTAPSDTITINASDSNGETAAPQTIAVTVNGVPVIAAPASTTITQDISTAITGVSLAESGDTAGESFTVILTDTTGELSASGTGISGSGSTSLTITGSLAQVNSDLSTLTYTGSATGSDTIAVNATDSFGNQGSPQSISVSVTPLTLSTLESLQPSAPIDWSFLEASLRPPSIDSTDWNLIWDRFTTQVGTTAGSLVLALSEAAATLNQIGEPTADVSTLLAYELEQASGVLPNITLADTTDLAPAGAGLDLSLTRVYSASLLNRNDPGPFGDGWTFTYDITAATDASGNVYITSPSGTETFTLQSDGSYAAQPGDTSTLTLSDGAYVLTSINGTVERFLPDGQLSSITDSIGDTINVNYDSNGFISSVTSPNGQSLTFTTNAQGRITSATDQDGQQTTYTYDASGDLLLSVSGPDGATRYSYDASGNPLTQNALTEIVNPDGTTESFAYDTQGDLISQAGSNGAGQITYIYPSTGVVTETDAAGNATTLIYDPNSNLAETEDALGNVTQYQYNSVGELTGVVTPSGGAYTYTYDSNGNLTGYTNPDGGTVSITYAPGTDLVTSFTDQDGNTTDYSYNSAGDLTGVTYDDGDGTSYQYSSNGLLTSSTNALGEATTYTYNAQGLLARETFSDGTIQAYSYNSLGELISAQATDGAVTTYSYNTAGELTSVTNPSGQVESYTYNSAGQELTRTEPDGSVAQYVYNSAGQLAELEDGSANLITQYTYNAEGELVGALDGNGQTTSYEYDADGNVTQILTQAADGTTTSELNYTYNADGLPVTVTSLDGTWIYTYDAMGQLINAVFASTNASIPDQNLTYEYDAAGNRTETIFDGAVNNYTTNGLNQYTASDGTTYDYDADGNLVSVSQNGATTTYTYNSQNQLNAVNGPNGNYTYQYDALGNVVSSTDNGVVSNYIIDPLAISTSATGPLSAIAQVYNAAGNVTATYDYGNGLAAMTDSSGTYYYNTDAIGNVTSLSGVGGELVDTYDYSPFGTLLASTGNVANPFQYSGGLGITTDSDGLVDMRARYYDPGTGRFISQDPVNILGETNLYNYASNSPIAEADPLGMYPTEIIIPPYQVVGLVQTAVPTAIEAASVSLGVSPRDLVVGGVETTLGVVGVGLGVLGIAAAATAATAAFPLLLAAGVIAVAGGAVAAAQGGQRLFYTNPASEPPLAKDITDIILDLPIPGKVGAIFNIAGLTQLTSLIPNSPSNSAPPPSEQIPTIYGYIEFTGYGDVVDDPAVLAYVTNFTDDLASEGEGGTFLAELSAAELGGEGGGGGGVLLTGFVSGLQQAEQAPPPAPIEPEPSYAPGGGIWAEPHLLTYDGLEYDFQAAGEFVLAKGTGDSTFQVQVRLEPYTGTDASYITQAAMQIGSDRVTIDPSRAQPLWVDGAPSTLGANDNTLVLPAGLIQLVGNQYIITYNSGEVVRVVSWGGAGLNVAVTLGPSDTPGTVGGLLGNDNGNPADDLALPDGTVLSQPISSSTLYGEYANAWRVTQATSLFDYGPGQSTATFTDLNFPADATTLSQFPASVVAQATTLVEQAGITDPGLQQSAIYDYIVTGNPTFITEDATLQQEGVTTTATAQVTVPSPQPLIGVDATETSVVEASSGTTSVPFQVYLTQTTSAPVTVDYVVTSPGSGYVDASTFGGTLPAGQVTIAAGQQTANFAVALPSGIGSQASEVLQVQVSTSSGIAIAAPTAQTTILNDEPTPGPQAVPGFEQIAGPGQLTQDGNNWTLDLGTIAQGASVAPLEFAAMNIAAMGADDLSGSFSASGDAGFTASLSDAFANLAAGGIWDFLALNVNTATPGTNTETVTFYPLDVNGTGYAGLLPVLTLTITDTIGVPQSGTPSIAAPTVVTVGVGQPAAISGVSISESPTTLDETFMVTLSDTYGVLSAAGGVASNRGTTLTINGSLTQVDSDLSTLTDTDATAGSDTITVNARDSNSGTASQQSIAVTVNVPPTITAPTTATVTQNQASAIAGVSVAETGNTTSGESFTVVLADTNGVLSANTGAIGGGGMITPSSGGTTLTIAGTLAQVDADLTTLTDNDPSTATDSITVNAKDSFGNSASQLTITATVIPVLTVAQYLADPSTADGAPEGFDITDMAANVSTIFDTLNADPHLDSITLTDPLDPLTVSVAQIMNDAEALRKLTNGYNLAVTDTAADVSAALDALQANPHVVSITLTDPLDPLTVSVAQITNDAGALGKLTNGYGLAVTDSAADVSAALDALEANPHVASITLSDPSDPLTVSVAQITSDAGALGNLTNGYSLAVTDTAADLSAAVGALQANAHVASITLSDPSDPLTVSVAQITSDAGALGKLTNGYSLAVTDTAANVSAALDALQANAHVASITLTNSGTPVLTLSIQQALNDMAALGKIVSPHTVAIADNAANIAVITSAQASALEAAGYTRISATGPLTLTVAQAWMLSGDGLVVTGGPVTIAGPAATMLALTAAQDAAFVPAGYVLEVADTAAHIQALTTAQISSLAALHVTQVASTDTSISLTTAKAIAFESAHIGLSAPVGSTVEVSDTAAHLEALTAAQITALPGIGVAQLVSNNGAVKYTVAQTVAIESASLAVSAPGASVTLSDTASNLQTLTAGEIEALPGLRFAGVTSTNASVVLKVAQALGFETIGFKITVPSGDKITITDTAANVETLTTSQIAGLPAIGVGAISATGAGVTLDVALALALEAAAITLTVPSGDIAMIADIAANIETLTPAQIASLTTLHVTQIEATDAGVTLTLAQALALESAKVSLSLPTGDSAIVVDTAAHLETLTAAQIASLSSTLHVSAVEASDTTLALTTAQAVAFESAHIGLSAPVGSTVEVSDTAAHLEALTAAQITALPGIGVAQLVSNNGAVKYTVAQTVAIESASLAVSAPGASVTLSDTASNLQTLTAGEIEALPGLRFAGVTSTNASVVLKVAQALGFETIGFKITVPSGDKITITDTAANVETLTTSQIAGLPAIGVGAISATGAGVTLDVAQALALEAAAITLTVPSGDIAMIADIAANIETLTPAQIASLTTLHVTQIEATDAGVTLTLAQALALESAKVSLSLPTGDSAIVVDTAAHLETLTAAQIASLSSTLHVSAVEASDTTLALTTAQAVAFESAHIGLSAPVGSTVEVSDTAAHLQALTAAQITALPGIGVSELLSNNANVSYSVAQTAAILASGLTVAAAGSDTVTENFADGDYSLFENGALITQKSVNADGSYDIAHFNVSGLGYSSYEDIYNASGTHVAEAQDMTNGSGTLLLYGNGLTVNSGPGQLSVTTGADTFALNPHANEAITATGHNSEVFAYEAGFGQSTITGFAATGASHDLLQFPTSMFSNAAAVLNNASLGANVAITDPPSTDTLTLNSITKTTLAANPGDFRFT